VRDTTPPGNFAVGWQLTTAKGSGDAGALPGRLAAQPDSATEMVATQAAIGNADLRRDNELPPERFAPPADAGGEGVRIAPLQLHRLASFDGCSDSAGAGTRHRCQQPTAQRHFRPRFLALSLALIVACIGHGEPLPLVCR
jgi:hypothetical protein